MSVCDEELLRDYDKFMDLFDRRFSVQGVGYSFTGSAKLGYLAAESENEERLEKLQGIFVDYGRYLEFLNALGDFILPKDLTHEKVANDQLADLKNGILTLPVWEMYNFGTDEDREFLQGCSTRELNEQDYRRALGILFETGTYERLSKSLKRNGRNLKKRVKNLKIENPSSRLLQQMMTIFESNKIYKLLEKDYVGTLNGN